MRLQLPLVLKNLTLLSFNTQKNEKNHMKLNQDYKVDVSLIENE